MAKVTTISICAKCSDMCQTELFDAAGKTVVSHDGYVAPFMPGQHYGDYIMLDIDVETGTIKNWKKPSQEELAKYVKEKKEDK